MFGFYTISLRVRVNLDTSADNNHFTNTNNNFQIAPETYYAYHPKDKPWALGLGIYVPFGFAVDYPDDTPFRTEAHRARIGDTAINPVMALQLTHTLSNRRRSGHQLQVRRLWSRRHWPRRGQSQVQRRRLLGAIRN